MKRTLSSTLYFLTSIILFLSLNACHSSDRPTPTLEKIGAGSDEKRDNVITLVTNKPIGSTIALSIGMDERINQPLMVEGLKDAELRKKKDREYFVFTITNPVIKLIGPIRRLACAPPTDEDLYPLEEDNEIISIVVSPSEFLTNLNCDYHSYSCRTGKMGSLKYIDVTKAPHLEYLLFSYNQVSQVDVTQNPKLVSFYCEDNRLSSLDLSKNKKLQTLSVTGNPLEKIDLSQLKSLQHLDCYGCKLQSLDLKNNPYLDRLFASNNNLTSLDLTNNLYLVYLLADQNQLQEIHWGKHLNLEHVSLTWNNLSALNLGTLPALKELYCESNQISELDFSKNSRLEQVSCFNNSIRDLAMTKTLGSLPHKARGGNIAIINPLSQREKNRCKKSDVALALERNWNCLQVTNNSSDFSFYRDTDPYPGED